MQMMIFEPRWFKRFVRDQTKQFCAFIWQYYYTHGRRFAWRHNKNSYHVLISEIMLQQTQTSRVAYKYELFLQQFPTLTDLAAADLRAVLAAWQGLGYNRRAKFLHKLAQMVVKQHDGLVPDDERLLQTLPGIGAATAASICAFAFNKPTIFIETNIRAVFLHCFFSGQNGVHDKALLPLIAQTVDECNPREWYYALMDYGVYLKQHVKNPSRASKHHVKQSTFEGSDRQIRGAIIRLLTAQQSLSIENLCNAIQQDQERVVAIIKRLCQEQLIQCIDDTCMIP